MENKHLSVDKLTLLHSIRGFAALYVVFCHSKWIFWVGGEKYIQRFPIEGWGITDYIIFALDMLSSNGSSMVMVFYMLSGFFISYTMQMNQWTLKEFYLTRILRIYIPFVIAMFVAYATLIIAFKIQPLLGFNNINDDYLLTVKGSYDELTVKCFLRNLFFLRQNGFYFGGNFVVWSLLYELIFYILAPFVYRNSTVFLNISSFIFFASVFWLKESMFLEFHFIHRFFLKFSFFFALGMWLHDKLNAYDFNKNKPKDYKNLFILSIGLLMMSFYGGLKHEIFIYGIRIPTYNISLVTATVSSCMVVMVILGMEIRRNLFIRFFSYLGKISYSLYLFHVPSLILLSSLSWRIFGQVEFYQRYYYLAIPFTIIFSSLFYFLFEEQSIRLISKLKVILKNKRNLSE